MSLRLAIAELPGLPDLLDLVVPGFVRRHDNSTPPFFDPANESSLISRIVADDLNALGDGDAINNTDDGTPGPGWPARAGANFASSAWAFSTRPVLKKNILNGHSVVRFDGAQNTMRAAQPVVTTTLQIFVCGVKRGSANNSGFLTIHKNSDTDDVLDVAELELYEGSGGTEFIAPFRNGQKSKGLHPGVGVPFVYCAKFTGGDCSSYLGDWRSLSVTSAGDFASDWIGIGAVHQNGGYTNNSQIDIAEVCIFTSADDALRVNMLNYFNTTYGIVNPRVFVALGDSISAGATNWPSLLIADYDPGVLYLENLAVGGHNLDQVATDALNADLYNRIGERTTPGRTIVNINEYVNAKNAGDLDQAVVDKHHAMADLVHGASPLALVTVALDWHDGTCSVDCSGASLQLGEQAGTWANGGIVNLNLQSLRDSCIAFDGGTHLNPTDYHIVSDTYKPVIDPLLI